jgi:hypothetical protein
MFIAPGGKHLLPLTHLGHLALDGAKLADHKDRGTPDRGDQRRDGSQDLYERVGIDGRLLLGQSGDRETDTPAADPDVQLGRKLILLPRLEVLELILGILDRGQEHQRVFEFHRPPLRKWLVAGG